ncbi:15527_t:CDS:2 [Gigaspora margarita]|uniref:15527_t:CDS:1 n=1 Tax=Gigaspora margarita TaxID=4874 RepID=A0ABN7V1J9_GIGMA|nr:15527_t:CDS:2 [Gigaspora margarita]
MKPHVDEHYCLASVKTARTLAKVFVDDTIIISQDDKAKVGLGVLTVGRIFKTIQTINKPVSVADYDFPVSSKMKLIPSVYLIIDPANSNDSLRLGQLAIFVRPEYFVGTISLTHISDLENIIPNQEFAAAIMKENKVKPVWVLLVDSAYNPVERSMAFLSEKLARKVVNEDLALKTLNLQKKAYVIYGEEIIYMIEDYAQIYHYLLDIKKCKNPQYCNEYRAANVALLLDQNNGFLPPIMKGKN